MLLTKVPNSAQRSVSFSVCGVKPCAWCGFYMRNVDMPQNLSALTVISEVEALIMLFSCVFSLEITLSVIILFFTSKKAAPYFEVSPSCCYWAGLLLTCNKNKTWKSLTKWNEYSPPIVQGNKHMKKREAQETVMVVLISKMGTGGCNEQQQELSNSKMKNVPECF